MKRVLAAAVLGFAGFGLGLDLAAPPGSGHVAALLVGGVELYQATLSPLVARAGIVCRFEPSCSHYAVAVLERHGALGGSWRAAWRLLRCGPWTPAGTVDPP